MFAAPDDYDVARRPEPIMTFGIGPHFCLGAHLARAELVTALGTLLERLPGLTLLDRDSTRIHGTVLRRPPPVEGALELVVAGGDGPERPSERSVSCRRAPSWSGPRPCDRRGGRP